MTIGRKALGNIVGVARAVVDRLVESFVAGSFWEVAVIVARSWSPPAAEDGISTDTKKSVLEPAARSIVVGLIVVDHKFPD